MTKMAETALSTCQEYSQAKDARNHNPAAGYCFSTTRLPRKAVPGNMIYNALREGLRNPRKILVDKVS
jgi:hypothetical protein